MAKSRRGGGAAARGQAPGASPSPCATSAPRRRPTKSPFPIADSLTQVTWLACNISRRNVILYPLGLKRGRVSCQQRLNLFVAKWEGYCVCLKIRNGNWIKVWAFPPFWGLRGIGFAFKDKIYGVLISTWNKMYWVGWWVCGRASKSPKMRSRPIWNACTWIYIFFIIQRTLRGYNVCLKFKEISIGVLNLRSPHFQVRVRHRFSSNTTM